MSGSTPFLTDMPWPAAAVRLSRPDAVGLLPIGATEAHGPHLPLDTDVCISLELCRRVATVIGDRAIILPPMAISVTTYAAGFGGTISISPPTSRAMLIESIASLGRHGLPVVALINSHLEPGHIAVLRDVAGAASSPRVLFVDHCRKPWALELGDEFKSGDCHAGEYETSLMLASGFASKVNMASASALPTANHGLVAKMRAGAASFEAMGATQAYFGHPSTATVEEGERLWHVLTRMWIETISNSSG